MTDIDAIMDLASAIEPGLKIKPTFNLWSDSDGLWHAKVTMDRYFVMSNGHNTPEGAITKLRAELLGLNQSYIKRMTEVIRRWTGTEGTLRLVRDDSK